MNEDYGGLLYNFGRNYEEKEAEELTSRIVEFFKKHPDIPPTEENIIEQFPNDDESLIMKVIDRVIEGLSMTDEQRKTIWLL